MKRTSPLLAAALFAGLVLVGFGCGGADDTEAGNVGGEAEITYPAEPDTVVFRIHEGGGFLPVDIAVTEMPSFSLYGDGQVITFGPMIEIYPPPVPQALQAGSLSPEAVREILIRAEEAGLLEENVDYGSPTIADATTTTFTVQANGRTVVTDVYALGFEPPGDASAAGLTQDQIERRRALTEFRSGLGDLESLSGEGVDWQPYHAPGMAVFARPAGPQDTAPGDVEPNRLEWPLDDLATAGEETTTGFRRIVVDEKGLDKLRPLLEQASTITLWESNGDLYRLSFRPLLPDEVEAPSA